MMHILNFPSEIFTSIIEHLVVSVGIYKAVQLRLVNSTSIEEFLPKEEERSNSAGTVGAFDSDILFAIFTRQVVDVFDPATPWLYDKMPPTFKGKLFLSKTSSGKIGLDKPFAVVNSVNQALDDIIKPNKEQQLKHHQMISEAIATTINTDRSPYSNKTSENPAENLFCGAIVIGNLALIKTLLPTLPRYAANIDLRNDWFGIPIQIAASWGHFGIVQYLLDHGANPSDSARRGHEIMDIFLGIPFHAYRSQGGSALQAAALIGHEQIVNLFLKPDHLRRFYEREYLCAMLAAARGGHTNIIDSLLQNSKTVVNDLGDIWHRILFEAVYHNSEAVVRNAILHRGVYVDQKSPDGERTALFVAASQGYVSMIRFLIQHGASLDGPLDSYCCNPIEVAAERGHEEAVEVLLEYGASLEKAFIAAAFQSQTHLVKRLLQKGLDVHLEKAPGATIGLQALFHGIAAQNPTIISLMVDAGVSLENDGKTNFPIVHAKAYSEDWIVEFLLSLGAKDRVVPPEVTLENHIMKPRPGSVRVTKRTWEWAGKY